MLVWLERGRAGREGGRERELDNLGHPKIGELPAAAPAVVIIASRYTWLAMATNATELVRRGGEETLFSDATYARAPS